MSLDDLNPGSVFAGDFRIERAYRQSALGAMYVVTQISTEKERALIIPRHTLRGEAATTFLDEARAAATLPSAHIVQAIGLGIDDETGRPWVVIEVLKGEELGSWFGKRGPLDPAELDEFFFQLCDPLAAAHEVGLVHRDVRPLNIFVGEAEREGEPFLLKVRGFGMFRLLASAPNRPKRTPWSAPELLRGEPPTPSTDVWSLGLLAYHLLTGKTYFGVDPAEPTIQAAVATAILEAPLPPASQRATEQGVGDRLPEGFDDWFATCVARDPLARYLNAREARTELRHVLVPNPSMRPPPPIEPAPPSRTEVAKKFSGAVVAIAALATIAIAATALVYPRKTATPPPTPLPIAATPSVEANAIPSVLTSPAPSVAPSATPSIASIAVSESPPFDMTVAKQTLNTVGYQKCGVTTPGKVVVTFAPKGTVAAVSVAEGGYDGPTRECLDRVFRYVTIPPFRGVRQSMFVALK